MYSGSHSGSNEDIKKFATGPAMGATFDLFAKVEVNGDEADPVWKFLKEEQVCLQSVPTY